MKKLAIFSILLFFGISLFGSDYQAEVSEARNRLSGYKQATLSTDISSLEYEAKCADYHTRLYRIQGQIYSTKHAFDRIKNRIIGLRKVTTEEINELNELKTRYDDLVQQYETLLNEFDNYVKVPR